MRKLYNEFFGISEDGKIREKVMIARVITTVAIMVMCLTAMSMTAYAYFSHEVATSNNIIKSAEFSIDFGIKSGAEDVAFETVNSKTFRLQFEANKEYTVTVTHKGTAATGFCTVNAENSANGIYHTQQLFAENSALGENTITFKLSTTKATVVTFIAHWGTSSKYTEYGTQGANGILYIENNEVVEIPIANPANLHSSKPPVENDEDVVEESVEVDDETTEEEKPVVNENGEIVHIVKDGESLSKIGDLYGRSSRDLAYYNELENPDTIKVGQKILIPPSDWKRPKDTVETSTEQTEDSTETNDGSTEETNETEENTQ